MKTSKKVSTTLEVAKVSLETAATHAAELTAEVYRYLKFNDYDTSPIAVEAYKEIEAAIARACVAVDLAIIKINRLM